MSKLPEWSSTIGQDDGGMRNWNHEDFSEILAASEKSCSPTDGKNGTIIYGIMDYLDHILGEYTYDNPYCSILILGSPDGILTIHNDNP